MRRLVLIFAMLAVSAAVWAAPPRGKRLTRPAPTHVVIREAKLTVGDATFTLRPGVQVAAGKSRKGVAQVELTGSVGANGAADAAALGKVVATETAVAGGRVYPGALVRVASTSKDGNTATVASAGTVRATFDMPASALSVDRVEFVYPMPANHHFVTPFSDTRLYAVPESVGTNAPEVAEVAGGVEVVLIEQRDTFALVRSHGPVELEGWALARQFADEGSDPSESALLKPTHEVFTGAALYGDVASQQPIARLAGGTLLEVNVVKGDRAKVTTTGEVIASGWVVASELRELARE
jgi:hypothetical protein